MTEHSATPIPRQTASHETVSKNGKPGHPGGRGDPDPTRFGHTGDGANTPQEGGDRIALAVNEAFRLANLWWRPGYAGATVTYSGRTVVDHQTLDELTITPRGGRPFGAGFDVNTHLLVQITEDRQFFHTRTTKATSAAGS